MLNSENKIIRIDCCDSTNNYAKQLLSKSEPTEGTVIITDKQTKGRGQFGNKWNSEDEKNLTFSIITKPTFLIPINQFYLSKITSIACILTLTDITNKEFKIKWPNDIYYNEKKIAGILIENTINSENIIDSIIGIGININQTFNEKSDKATSLVSIFNSEFDKERIFNEFLMNFEKFYILLKNKKHYEIDQIYQNLLLDFNKERKFTEIISNKKFNAVIKGVNTIGQLELFYNQKSHHYNLKEIKWQF